MKITFWGAAREVTGSRHLLEVNGSRVLLDCGLFQGRRDESEAKNRHLGFNPGNVDAVVLSHAHIDHTGALPMLVQGGFRGRVHGTWATTDLCNIMLLDSAHIQEKDVEYVNKRGRRAGRPPREPLYTTEDAQKILEKLKPHPYDTPFEVAPGVSILYRDAGHMLGSASVEVRVTEVGRTRTLVFSGDWGRRQMPILRDPVPVPAADILIMESTYGDKIHPPAIGMADAMLEVLRPVFARGGKVIIPAFAVGRTQTAVYELGRLMKDGQLPRVPVYVDSPLAVDATEVMLRHPECYDDEMRELLAHPGDPFGFKMATYVRTAEESKALNDKKGPFVVISASGMAETGRVLHHLANNVGDPKNAVLIIGYQAEHTLGRRLRDHEPMVRIFGDEFEVRCDVFALDGFSGHGDRQDLMQFATGFTTHRPDRVFLVHGEPLQQDPFAERLRREGGYTRVDTPHIGQTYEC